jgi:hypothetical protein
MASASSSETPILRAISANGRWQSGKSPLKACTKAFSAGLSSQFSGNASFFPKNPSPRRRCRTAEGQRNCACRSSDLAGDASLQPNDTADPQLPPAKADGVKARSMSI